MTTLPTLDDRDTTAMERGEYLRALRLMEEQPDPEFYDLVSLAASICGKPMSAMTLLDESTQLTKARVGLEGEVSIPIGRSMCQYTLQGSDLLMVEDVNAELGCELSRGWCEETGIRFYAGMPLVSDNGTSLGALCVMDSQPSSLTEQQQQALRVLGRQLSYLIQLRKHARDMERMAAERDRQQKMFDIILNNLPLVIYLKDREGRFRFLNQRVADRFQVTREQWLGKTSYDLWSHEIAHKISEEDQQALLHGVPCISQVDTPERDGSFSHWQTYKVPCLNADGEAMLACCSVDLTEQTRREAELQRVRSELEEANGKLQSLALTDALTGLWNRRAFDARLETSVLTAHRHKRPLTLMLLDVDHFKCVNDRFGHPYGDAVLKEIAELLNRSKRGDDIAFRFGGEEFAILLPDTDIESARHLADRMLNATRHHSWEKTPVTVSIGLSMCLNECTSDNVVDAADAALYRAKRGGRDRVVLYSDPG